MEECVLILGNGFDLDLGLKTSYSDFMDSDDFKAIVDNNYFARYLQERRAELGGNWIDIENEIKTYVQYITGRQTKETIEHNKKGLPQFKEDYYGLIEALKTYMSNIDYSNINKNSCAASILKEVINHGYFSILSFNYTDLTVISDQLGLSKSAITNRKNSFVKHIHGSIKDKNIILGVEDNPSIDEKYCYVEKSMNKNYISNNVRETLKDASTILFFGHSLGETDYMYFKDFFSLQSGVNNENFKKKYIRLFTFNDESEDEIMRLLRNMNNQGISYLKDSNNFRVYRTSEDDIDFSEVLKSLNVSRIENLKEESNAKPRGVRRRN